MAESQVRVGALSAQPTGYTPTALGGRFGEQITSDLGGKYFNQNANARLWSASVAAAAAIPLLATNASPTFAIFNPAGNNTAVVLVRFNVAFSAGTGVAGAIGYAYLSPAGSATAGTAAPISAGTPITIKPGVIGANYGGNIQALSAATIGGVVSALTLLRWSNMSQGAPITSTATSHSLYEDFDGNIIIPPNTLWAPIGSPAPAETFMMSVIAYEVPWPLVT